MEFHWGTVLRFLMRLMPVLGVGFILNTCAAPSLLLNPITYQLYDAGWRTEEMRPLIPYVFQKGMKREAVDAQLYDAGFRHEGYIADYSRFVSYNIVCASYMYVDVEFTDNRLTEAFGYSGASCI